MSKTINGAGTSYLYDGVNPVEELSGGGVSATMLTGSVDEYFQRTDSSGTFDYLTDALGSTVALAGPAVALGAEYTYEPFGNTTVSGSSPNPFQFTGRENDSDGLYFYRARYYIWRLINLRISVRRWPYRLEKSRGGIPEGGVLPRQTFCLAGQSSFTDHSAKQAS